MKYILKLGFQNQRRRESFIEGVPEYRIPNSPFHRAHCYLHCVSWHYRTVNKWSSTFHIQLPTKKNYSELYLTTVYYTLLLFKSTVLWNFDLLWKKYGTMENMVHVLWTKLYCYTENYGTTIYKEKKHDRYQKLQNFD